MKILFVAGMFVVTSCLPKDSNIGKTPDLIAINEADTKNGSLKFSEIESVNIDTTINLTSIINSDNKSLKVISLPVEGFLKETDIAVGDKVMKGEVVAILEHASYLKMKRDYLKAKAKYNFCKQNYTRQGELAIEQATSIKKMQLAEREYKSAETELAYLSSMLKLIGINANSLSQASLTTEGYLLSPNKGHVIESFSIKGKFYSNSEALFQLSTSTKMVGIVGIPDNYTLDMHSGDELTFEIANNKKSQGKAIVERISIDENFKERIEFYVDKHTGDIGKSIKLNVPVKEKVMQIPIAALIDNNFILVQISESLVKKMQIVPYKISSEYLFLRDNPELAKKNVLVQGVSDLLD